MASKLRIALLHNCSEMFHLLEIALPLKKIFAIVAAYQPYTQSAKSVLSILMTFALVWLQLSDTNMKIKA